MRKLLILLPLFTAVTAFAQPTVSAEIASGPLPFTNIGVFLPAPSVAMAKDRTGVAIAWMMPGADGDRINVVRLDATGHFTGQVQTIPVTSSDLVYVVSPSIAAVPRGDGFTLAWLEIISTSPPVTRAVYRRLDRDLNPSAPAVLDPVIRQTLTTPAIVRSGKTTWITAGGSAWEIGDDGSVNAPLNAGMNATDMTVATDVPQIVAFGQVLGSAPPCRPECLIGHSFFVSCSCPMGRPTLYSLRFTSLYSVTASTEFDFDSDAAPAIGSDGRDVAVVWLDGEHVKGGSVVMTRILPASFTDFAAAVNQFRVIGSFAAETGATRPDIASDGDRYVVVWRTATSNGSHDIVGASIDRAGNITPLSIATSAADERDPSVVALGDGTFLVAYERLNDGERRIAGRFVTFASRGRAVR